MVARRVPIEVSEDLPAPLNHSLVLGRARFVEEGGDVLIGHGLDTINPQQRRLAAEGLDLLDEPLEELRRFGRLGQDPARTPQAHGPHPLQLSPHAHPMPRWRARQARQERQPAHLVVSVTRATLPVKRYTRRIVMPPPVPETATTRASLAELVRYFLYLGTFGFGGPVALIGFMHRDLVERRRWVEEDEYRLGVALAQIMPGPLAAQLAIALGYFQ